MLEIQAILLYNESSSIITCGDVVLSDLRPRKLRNHATNHDDGSHSGSWEHGNGSPSFLRLRIIKSMIKTGNMMISYRNFDEE